MNLIWLFTIIHIKYCLAWGCSSVGRALAWHARGRRFKSDQLHQSLMWNWWQYLMTCNTHSSVQVRSAPPEFDSTFCAKSMADIAQLVRALVCGTKCRRFESGYPPHYKTSRQGRFLLKNFVFYDIIYAFSGRHLVVFFIARICGRFVWTKG